MSEHEDMTPEEIEALRKDIDKARDSLVSKGTREEMEKAKAEAKAEAEREFAEKQRLKELEEKNKQLEEQLKARERASSEEIDKIKSRLDEMISSRQVMRGNDPFEGEPSGDKNKPVLDVDRMSESDLDELERNSMKLFLENRVVREE